MRDLIDAFFGSKEKSISKGVRKITLATAVRWFGWGFAEPLLPVFIYSFGHTYAVSGALNAVYDIAFILALPVAGLIADRIPSAALVLVGLFIYPLVGLNYFLAGLTGVALFVVMSRLINGICFALDSVGRETYIREHAPREHSALAFGYLDAIANFWWIAAAIAGIFLVRIFPIHWLLAASIPSSIIAFFIVLPLVKRSNIRDGLKLISPRKAYLSAINEIVLWNLDLQILALINFFIAFVTNVITFFIPIYAYSQGTDLARVALIGIVLTLPYILGFRLGKIADRNMKHSLAAGLLLLAILVCAIGFTQNYILQLSLSFLIAMVTEFIALANHGLVTISASPEHFGRVSGLMDIVSDAGSLFGPLILGISIDMIGFAGSFGITAGVILLIFFLEYSRSKRTKQKPIALPQPQSSSI